MTEYWDPDSEPDYIKGDLLFVKEPPKEIAIECSICFHVMWKEPSLTSCGHHFCTSCIVVAQENNRPCPKCKAKYYDIFIDADRQRYICGLQIYCTNKKHGCNWKGELQDLSTHIAESLRDGECQFGFATCRHDGCHVEDHRIQLDAHEKNDCPERPSICQYCGLKRSHTEMSNSNHYDTCPRYPVPCPNKCDKTMPRKDSKAHIKNECPLQQVECDLSWAGCTVTTLRKDIQAHIASDPAHHIAILARVCKELKDENAELKKALRPRRMQ